MILTLSVQLMSNLTSVIGMIVNIKGHPEEYLRWDKEELAQYLRKCPTAHATVVWHRKRSGQVQSGDQSHSSLETLCIGVSACLVRAASRLELLRLWAIGDERLGNGISDRQVVISSLED